MPAEGGRGPIAVLALQNFTDSPAVPGLVLPLVLSDLRDRGEAVLSPDELRPVLREHRIRISNGIDEKDARSIGDATGADRLLLGSIDLVREGEDPELAVSLRAVRISDMRVIAAVSAGATGRDFAGLFGIGRIVDLESLAPRLVESLVRELSESVERAAGHPGRGLETVAVIPFDNLTGVRAAGEIATNAFLGALLREGYDVLEPGSLEQVLRRERVAPRGEISVPLLGRIDEELGANLVLTGVVQRFESEGGQAVPSAEFGIRLIDVPGGRILEAENRSVDGRDGETILGLGRIRSLGQLLRRSAEDTVHRMARKSRERIAALEG